MSRSREIEQVVEHLRAQEWEVAPTNDGTRYRAVPPHPDRQVVFFSAHPSSTLSVQLIIRDLRQQGFQWPPPKPPPDARHSATPFPSKPHPDASVGDEAPAPAPPAAPEKPKNANGATPKSPPATPATAIDTLFVALKEARLYCELARGERAQRAIEHDDAKQRLEAAERELLMAEQALADKKRAFDECLEKGQ